MTTEARLNARLDASVASKLAYLRRRTGSSTTDVVCRSIEVYYESVTRGTDAPSEVLEQTGFIGCGEGPLDLSTRYKHELTEILSNKS